MDSDRLSNLPDHLIHHIMAYLLPPDRTCFCVLSKRLSSAWLSFPSLDLDSIFWSFRPDVFFAFARRSLRQHRSRDTILRKLRFKFHLHKNTNYEFKPQLNSAAELLEEIAQFAVDNDIEDLSLHCGGDSRGYYVSIFSEYEILKAFPGDVFSSQKIRSLSLRGLNLASSDLIVSCPLIDHFNLACCSGLKSIEFSRVCKVVERIGIHKCLGLKRIRVDGSESLVNFRYSGNSSTDDNCQIDFSVPSGKSLKTLYINCSGITDEWLRNNVSKFESLESLILKSCGRLVNVYVDNESLKHFEFVFLNSIARIHVAVPGLESFVYNSWIINRYGHQPEINIRSCMHLKTLKMLGGVVTNTWIEANLITLLFLEDLHVEQCRFTTNSLAHGAPSPLVNGSNLKNAELCFNHFSDHGGHDMSGHSEFLKRLRNFLVLFGRCNTLLLSIGDHKENYYIYPNELRKTLNNPSLLEVKHLKIKVKVRSSKSRIMELVDSFLWLAPHLETLSFLHDHHTHPRNIFSIKFCYAPRNNPDVTCCSNGPVKWWQHELMEVVIQKFEDCYTESLQSYFMEKLEAARITLV